VRDVLLRALATEGDEVAGHVIEVLYRQETLIPELPARIDAAWRNREHRLATRLLAALVKSDDEGKYMAWARDNYKPVLRSLGLGN
jgi:hypothetical protein